MNPKPPNTTRYGLSATLAQAVLAQGCEVCGTKQHLLIDIHPTHKTIRGCLCKSCDNVITKLEDKPQHLERYLAYIALHRNNVKICK